VGGLTNCFEHFSIIFPSHVSLLDATAIPKGKRVGQMQQDHLQKSIKRKKDLDILGYFPHF